MRCEFFVIVLFDPLSLLLGKRDGRMIPILVICQLVTACGGFFCVSWTDVFRQFCTLVTERTIYSTGIVNIVEHYVFLPLCYFFVLCMLYMSFFSAFSFLIFWSWWLVWCSGNSISLIDKVKLH